VNWWVQGAAGEKISKSKGGAGSIVAAADQYGADAIRLYYCHVGSPSADIEWSRETVANYRRKIEAMYDLLLAPARTGGAELTEPQRRLDRWLLAKLSDRTSSYLDAMDDRDLREAANIAFYEMHIDLRRYLDRGGHPTPQREYVETWVRLLAPFAPHLAEEAWETLGNNGFVSVQVLHPPKVVDDAVLLEEEYFDALVADLQAILDRVKTKASGITIFLAEDWKRAALGQLLAGAAMSDVIKNTIPVAKAAAPGAERDVPDCVKKMAEEARGSGDALRRLALLGESAAVTALTEDIGRKFGVPIIVKNSDQTSKAALGGEKKAKLARPYKPGILVN
jgi:leucyl-tRNA synthetase